MSHFAYKFIIRESLHVTLTSSLLYCFSFSFFEGIVNVSMLIYFFFCGCNVNSAHRNLFRCLLCYVVLKCFLSNLLVF